MLTYQVTAYKNGVNGKRSDLTITDYLSNVKEQIKGYNCDFTPDYFIVRIWKGGFDLEQKFTYYRQDDLKYDFKSLEQFIIESYLNNFIIDNEEYFNNDLKGFKRLLIEVINSKHKDISLDVSEYIDELLVKRTFKFKIFGELTKNEISFHLRQLATEIEQVHNINNINKSKLTKLEIEIN